jgi:spore coat polysaccharide biosynthesis predicted glycosyltransferase SpsG
VTGDVLRPIFRVAAGPRLGFGHLVRASRLARALGCADAHVSLRGPAQIRRTAAALGLTPVAGTAAELFGSFPDVLIVDDPSSAAARPWARAARRLGIPVVGVHDLGRAWFGADLIVDGSLPVQRRRVPQGSRLLAGPRYAIVDPLCATVAARRTAAVLIALGGGPRVGTARSLARAIRRIGPHLQVRIAGGFAAGRQPDGDGVTWLGALPSLAPELAGCAAAITAGGVTMYEAAAMRVPLVAWPVVRAQRPAVHAFGRHRLAVPVIDGPERLARAAAQVVKLAARGAQPVRSGEGRALDGRGASRVAAVIHELVRRQRGAAA